MKQWRPPNWDKIKKDRLLLVSEDYCWIYEAGADAMLEALKSKGALMSPAQMKLLAPDRQYPYGWLVFIPKEEK